MKKEVLVLYTGGTIGMKKEKGRSVPVQGFLREYLHSFPEVEHPFLPSISLIEFDPVLDSSNIESEHWQKMAFIIYENYHLFDGFVVLHGTDTMAFSSSALSFLLKGLSKPVIFTGAQIPLSEIRNDARDNLITSLILAAHYNIPEVCVCFGDKLFRGNRITKLDAEGFNAFESPNFPYLGNVGIHIEIDREKLQPTPDPSQKLEVREINAMPIVSLCLFPGISAKVVENVLKSPVKGLVLESFGVGNGPSLNRELFRCFEEANQREVLLLNRTQCLKGKVNMKEYDTGADFIQAGFIGASDMTREASLTKMLYLLNQNLTHEERKTFLAQDLRGELTETEQTI